MKRTRLAWFWVGVAAFALVGCTGGKVARCRSNDDCGDQARYCVYGKCVMCRGEDDCKSPNVCGLDHVCKSLVIQ